MIDPDIQAQVDAQLLEQGSFSPLEFLLNSGRLAYADYEGWRRKELPCLTDALMGNPQTIFTQLEQAGAYALGIGLTQDSQVFHAWERQSAGELVDGKPLTVSADPALARLIASIYKPAQRAPQLDLFFDNPVVALTNRLVDALCARELSASQQQLDRLYLQAPTHADLPAFDRLVLALAQLDQPVEAPARDLAFLLDAAPLARRLLGARARDLMTPLWRRLSQALAGLAFSPEATALHASFTSSQAQDWAAVAQSVLAEPQWWRHPPLCVRLAHSGFYRQRREDALNGWFQLCWAAPGQAAEALETPGQPDRRMAALWRSFVDSDPNDVLKPGDFPAWMLLNEPGLAQVLPVDLPRGQGAGESHYRCVHRWIHARRTGRHAEEMAQRKALMLGHPLLFQWLKRSV